MGEGQKAVHDWTYLPFIGITSAGFLVAGLDFVLRQDLTVQWSAVVGLVLLAVGGYLRMKARVELKAKARFPSLAATGRLQTMNGHQLATDGLYTRIRHPIYLGEILRNFGIVTLLTSVYGAALIAAATLLLLRRIELEETLMLAVFGEAYQAYQRTTKKLVPYVY